MPAAAATAAAATRQRKMRATCTATISFKYSGNGIALEKLLSPRFHCTNVYIPTTSVKI